MRVIVLDDRYHRDARWRSSMSHLLYRWHNGWEVYYQGKWEPCGTDFRSCYYQLCAQHGERFIRVAQEI